jgi:lipase chaperone LimK
MHQQPSLPVDASVERKRIEAQRGPHLPVKPADLSSQSGDPSLPRSLRETEIDGWLGVDDDGHLVVTPGARWFFDYFLSATGEESADDLRARIVSEIERRLPPTGAHEATALLDRYLSYRERVRAVQARGLDGDLRQRLAELHEIRVDTFGPTDAAILFGAEEQVQSADLQRRAVMSDTSLDPDERERQLAAIEQQLPAEIRAARAETFAPLHLMQDEQALRDAGGSPEDIQALRTQRFGADAAERLAALDREHAQWRERVDDYQRARSAIEADASLNDAARAEALDALIAQRFTEQERLRVEAVDQPR